MHEGENSVCSVPATMHAILHIHILIRPTSLQSSALGCALFSLTNSNLVQLELLIKLWSVRESRANRILPNDWLKHLC